MIFIDDVTFFLLIKYLVASLYLLLQYLFYLTDINRKRKLDSIG